MQTIEKVEGLSQEDFLGKYLATNTPVIIKGVDYDIRKWSPVYWKAALGKMPVQVYDALFDLQGISTLADYISDNFNKDGPYPENVPYIRWYSKLKEVEYVWSDEAFQKISNFWKKPAMLPTDGFLVPYTPEGKTVNPTTDRFPYRGLLIAARGARTRIHRDPFCSDAVVCQFFGTKEISLYHPARTEELTERDSNNSFGGFIDVRAKDINKLSHEPDFYGLLEPGEMIYIPHGWLHDVIVTDDSLSVTWNFVHKTAAVEFINYLEAAPKEDSEFETLCFFHSMMSNRTCTVEEMLTQYRAMLPAEPT